ncbi:DMT family transporter [Paucibacter sp. APW11]|uniref:DMT family transporter n=2 Tax=Roseateles aquae TaxID=3077235 RepID=A0ABU3P658_9BURK|nr:DMT family transporter [Paucibacter sp. APW11]MDT8998059.1 DMT family transporter [Paucibacter sp. APW11]
MPALFVAIWSTGFVVARLGMPHAPPLSFLALRFALSALCLLGWALWVGARWPQGRGQWFHLAVLGALMHAGYLGAGWAAVKQGLGAGTMSLIAGLQPVLTAVYLSLRPTQARLSGAQWAGLGLGTIGLVLVVWRKLGLGEASALNLSLGFAALMFITVAALYQQRFVRPCDSRTALCVQMLAACLLMAPLGLLEGEAMDWVPALYAALGWSVLGLTLGGSSLLYLMLQRGAATRVTSLMYLVPPCAAMLSWMLFGEQLGAAVWLGMGLSAAGVYLVIRR